MQIQESFGRIAKEYDLQRKKIIACHDELYTVALPLIKLPNFNPSPRILDIGAGTGLFSSFILKRYPLARITLIDLSSEMLDIARERFKGRNFTYITDDYTQHEYSGAFDLIISSLSIHHLSAPAKENLYKKVHDLLVPGGVFINADQVLSPSPELERREDFLWREEVQSSGLGEQAVKDVLERTHYDNPSTLEDQLLWLKEAGFSIVDTIYKRYRFAVIFSEK